MPLSAEIARQIREVHFGGNWTDVSLQKLLEDVDWKEATHQVDDLNSIAVLVFHISYYISAVLKVLQKGPLEARDKYSFNLPEIRSQKDWDLLLKNVWQDAEEFAKLIEKMSDKEIWSIMLDQKYGSYYRNFQGIIEHFHYHMGQISLLKKMIRQQDG